MNDFTKKELRDIQHYIEAYYDYNPKGNLHNKIQSMIDNYCEHEWENICCHCDLDRIYCHKCERTMHE